jgi:hypothetical protein
MRRSKRYLVGYWEYSAADKAEVTNTKITLQIKEHLPIEMFAGVFYWSGFF